MTWKAGTVTGSTKTTAAKSQSLVLRRAKEKGLGTDTGGWQVHRKWQPVQWSMMVGTLPAAVLNRLSMAMLRPQFGIRTLIIFVTNCTLLFTVHQFPQSRYSLPNYFGIYPDHCVRQPWAICRGWPMYSRTDVTALHPDHDTGPCKYDSAYHPVGLIVNSVLAISMAAIVTCLMVTGPRFLSRRAALRREQALADAAIVER